MYQSLKKHIPCPGWCGSVDLVLAYEPEPNGRQFDSQSGHMLGLQARSPVGGVQEATNWCISHIDVSLSLSPSFPFSLKKFVLKKHIPSYLTLLG